MDPYMNRLDSLWDKVQGGNSSDVSLASASSLRSSVLAILHQALADPKTFVGFIQLGTHPILSALTRLQEEDEVLAKMLRTCHLFSAGTWSQYRASSESGQYLDLTSSQIQKLKALSLVSSIRSEMKINVPNKSLSSSSTVDSTAAAETSTCDDTTRNQAMDDTEQDIVLDSSTGSHDSTMMEGRPKVIPYAKLQSDLDFKDVPSLEDFLIYCMYSKLVPPGSRLNPQHQCLMLACCPSSLTTSHVNTNAFGGESMENQSLFFSRDVSWSQHGSTDGVVVVADMISTLEKIQNQGMGLLQTLDMIQNQNEQFYHSQLQSWSDIDKRLGEVREYSKSTFQNTLSGIKWGSSMSGGGGGSSRGESRQSKRSRGVHYYGRS